MYIHVWKSVLSIRCVAAKHVAFILSQLKLKGTLVPYCLSTTFLHCIHVLKNGVSPLYWATS